MKSSVKLAAMVAAASLLAAGCSSGNDPATPAGSGDQTVKLGISQILTHPSLDDIRQGVIDCLGDGGYVEGQNLDVDYQNPEGDQAALTSIASSFSDKDLVVAITTPVAQSFVQALPDMKIVFAGVTDPVSAGLVKSFEAPGGNVTGSSDYPPIDQQIALIKKIKPEAKTIGIVYASSEANAEVQTELAKQAAERQGLQVRTAAITAVSEMPQAAASLAGVDAFYVGNDNTVVSGIEALISVAEQQQVPVIVSDPDSVTRGAVGAYAVSQHEMGCQAGKLAVKVLKGENPGSLPVVKMADLGSSDGVQALTLTLNKEAAAKQGVTLSDDLLSQAAEVI